MDLDLSTFAPGEKQPVICDRCGITIAWTHDESLAGPILICNLCMDDENNLAQALGLTEYLHNGMPVQSQEHCDEMAARIRASNNILANINNFIIRLCGG